MPFDLIQLINQIRNFLRIEKGTPLSLFVLEGVSFLVYTLIFGNVVKYYPKADFGSVFVVIAVIMFILWFMTTLIKTDKKRINIGLTLFDIVDLDPKNVHNSDVKYNIADELAHYIYARLTRGSYAYEFSHALNVVKLPARYTFSRDSASSQRMNSRFDLILAGQLFFQENGMFIDPQLIFVSPLKDLTFDYFKENFSKDNRFSFKPDGSENLIFDKLIHEIFYIGVTYQFVKLCHNGKFLEAEKLSNKLLGEIDALYKSTDQSVNLGDRDFAYIEAIIYLYKAKNLHKYGNKILFDEGNAKDARDTFERAAAYLLKRSEVLKRVLTKDTKEVDKEAADHAYIYSIGLLSKESADDLSEKQLEKLEHEFQDKNNFKLAQAIFAERKEHIDEALKKYLSIIKADPYNKYALRRITSIYFKKNDSKQAYTFSKQLAMVTLHHVYDEDLYDLRFISRFAQVSLSNYNFGTFFYYAVRLPFYAFANVLAMNQKTLVV